MEAAFELFSSQGYSSSTMSQIARAAGMTVANLYVYFDSKLFILYEIYQPWLYEQLDALRSRVEALPSARDKVRQILIGVWRDIPAADHSFANALIEALASAPPQSGKPVKLLTAVEDFLTELLMSALPRAARERVRDGVLAHIIWMAFDGFVINQRIGDVRDIEPIADRMSDLLLGRSANASA
ncbi:DNA-binding transcriptional regulator, AcrR family [Chitinasiproducens palmae]|uniref:DNA-binding transcriptional regulator, AcrR family n=1 Tax=Chitinasiproducens palmae TaxID=1770053 RepID=A0A1H2PLM0_9BURK|nr:DNA-binding transcriptional regulator, AcrR family [Chitinasiproducens palmae]